MIIIILGTVVFTYPSISHDAQSTGTLREKEQPNGQVELLWESHSALQVHIEPPLLTATAGNSKPEIPINLTLTSHSTKDDNAVFNYDIRITVNRREIDGNCRVECLLPKNVEDEVLLFKTQVRFAQPVQQESFTNGQISLNTLDITARYVFQVNGQLAKAVVLPERVGTVRTHEFEKAPDAFFDLGNAVVRTGTELAMPAIGLDFTTSSLAVSADPYTGTAFSAKPLEEGKEKHTQFSFTTIYPGSTTSVLSEERTIASRFHRNGIDGILQNFYHTIPDILPGPAWIHDIQLTFYDYIAETGKSLKPDLDALAKRIPKKFRKDWIWRDANGNPIRWWYWQKRPDTKEENYMLDPSNPEVQRWFMGCTAAYIKEFGRDLDALVRDETHCIRQGQIAKTAQGLVSVDRAMMEMVTDITREVQRGWASNPHLALLMSDNINKYGTRNIPFCLVAHGTYNDSRCDPRAWPPGLIPNYRNCLYSCNWNPVQSHSRGWNRIATEEYGLPQGLGNGYGDDLGPSEMPKEIMDEVIALFLKRCKSGKDRTRYLLTQSEPNKELKVSDTVTRAP